MFAQHKKRTNKPKIAIIHPSIGESFGGSQIFVLELAKRLKEKCDITIFSSVKENEICMPIPSISRKKAEKITNNVFKLVKKYLCRISNSPNVLIEHITSFIPVLYHLLINDYDLIYPNNDWGGLLAASIVRKIKGTPVLFTEHAGLTENGKIAERNIKFNPDKYIVLSEEMKFWVKKYHIDTNVFYIPNGVDLIRFNPYIKAANVDLPRPIILTAARYTAFKRLDLVIDTVAALEEGSLLILSQDVEILYQKGIKKLGKDRFMVINADFEKMASYYRACDVFTLPSVYEPFGLVYLEAMACNKPVVAPYDHSRESIVGEAGVLCDVTDIESYKDSLKLAIRTNYGNKPFRQASRYTWEKCAEQYYNVIQEIISSRYNLNKV